MGNCFSSPKEGGQPLGTQTNTTKRTEKVTAIPTQKTSTQPKPKVSSKGHVLGGSSSSPDEKEAVIDPKEAARKAAQERYEAKNSKQGKLGQKLQEERNKSSRVHLKEAAEQKLNEKANEKNQLIYD